MSITKRHFGNLPDGQEVTLFTLTNKTGLQLKSLIRRIWFHLTYPIKMEKWQMLF